MIRCIAVDDEPPALDLLKSYLDKTPFIENMGVFYSSVEALEFIKENEVDVAFLDINMPDLSGLDLSRLLPAETKVVFTTAYEEYALEGFKVSALEYLVKPFGYADFLAAAQKALEYHNMRLAASQSSKAARDFLFVKADYKIHKVLFEELLFAENQKDYIKLHRVGKKPLMVLMPLRELEGLLPDFFMKVHRSYLVNLRKVTEVERGQILMEGHRVPVSDAYKEAFTSYLQNPKPKQ